MQRLHSSSTTGGWVASSTKSTVQEFNSHVELTTRVGSKFAATYGPDTDDLNDLWIARDDGQVDGGWSARCAANTPPIPPDLIRIVLRS